MAHRDEPWLTGSEPWLTGAGAQWMSMDTSIF